MEKSEKKRIRFKNGEFLESAMFGVIVGDALGVPFEFKRRDSFKVEDMVGFGTHHQPAGTWSDDSSMTLATLESFIECDYFDYEDLMNRFSSWLCQGEYCPYGKCFDVGCTTVTAIGRYKEGETPLACGGKGLHDNGNGSLMRILPIAFVEHTVDDILHLSSLTHAHEISLMCCRLYIQLVENLMKGMQKEDAIKNGKEYNGYQGFGYNNIADLSNDGVGISNAGLKYLIDLEPTIRTRISNSFLYTYISK